jgi:hypothetical protein
MPLWLVKPPAGGIPPLIARPRCAARFVLATRARSFYIPELVPASATTIVVVILSRASGIELVVEKSGQMRLFVFKCPFMCNFGVCACHAIFNGRLGSLAFELKECEFFF